MTLTCQPFDAISGSPAFSAQQSRQAFTAHLGDGGASPALQTVSGFTPGRTPAISATSSTYTIPAFAAVVDPGFTATQGAYEVASDTTITGSVAAANASNPRYDILYLTISDPSMADGSSTPSAVVGYLSGTAASSPAVPATPARSFLLATLYVPASGGGSPAVTTNPARAVAAGGILPTSSSLRPANPHTGMTIFESDTGLLQTWNGSGWQPSRPGGPLGYVGAATGPGSTTNFTGASPAVTVAATVIAGRHYELTGSATGSASAAGSNVLVAFAATAGTGGGSFVVVPPVLDINPTTVGEYVSGTGVALWVASTSGTVTFALNASSTSGNLTISAGASGLVVKDIGT